MRKALETLPWVEKGSVKPDIEKQQATFAVKNAKDFNLAQVKKVIDEAGFEVGKVLRGP